MTIRASRIAATNPHSASTAVEGRAAVISVDTAAPEFTEKPKSPCRKPTSDCQYWMYQGASAP